MRRQKTNALSIADAQPIAAGLYRVTLWTILSIVLVAKIGKGILSGLN